MMNKKLHRVMNLSRVMMMACVVSFAAASSNAAPILAIDFGAETTALPAGSPVQSGFIGWSLPDPNSSYRTASPSQTFGSYTVTFHGSLLSRDRNGPNTSGGYTNKDLARDLWQGFDYAVNGATPVVDAFTITGLAPSTQYTIRIWSINWGFDGGTNYSWYDRTTGTSTLLGTIINPNAATPTSDTSYSMLATVTSSASGTLKFGAATSNGFLPVINAFELTAVPEPATLALLGIGGLLMGVRRRGL